MHRLGQILTPEVTDNFFLNTKLLRKKKSQLDVFLMLKDLCIKLLISSGIRIYSVSIYDRIQIKEANYSVELT